LTGFRVIALILALLAPAPARADEPAFDPAPWLADLEAAQTAIEETYPNLDWAIETRGLDLAQLARDTAISISAAASERGARSLFRDFLDHFGDGHLYAVWPDEVEPPPFQTPASLCRSIGFEQMELPSAPDYAAAGFTPVSVTSGTGGASAFQAFIRTREDGRKTGLVRIASFWEWGYFGYCRAAVRLQGAPEDGECDQACADAIAAETARLLTEDFAAAVKALKQEGATILAADVTGNDGGSALLEPLARMLTAKPLFSAPLAFTRTPKWSAWARDTIPAIEQDLARAWDRPALQMLLAGALDRARQIAAEADDACDRSGVWENKAAGCDILARGLLFDAGLIPYAPPGSLDSLASRYALFNPSYYAYEEGLWRGPLLVLVDRGTASAAETFAALLRDNGAATILGEATFGAGCGWDIGQDWVVLPATGAKLYIPDCASFEQDGINKVSGLDPDLPIAFRGNDTASLKARRIGAALDAYDPAMPRPGPPPRPDGARSGRP
jgi:hypothetical protein